MRRTLIIALAAALPALAAAETPTVTIHTPRNYPVEREVKSTTVSLRDYDLNTAQGAESAVGRLRRAAERTCGPGPSSKRALPDLRDYQQCVDSALADAVQQTGNANLLGVYQRAD